MLWRVSSPCVITQTVQTKLVQIAETVGEVTRWKRKGGTFHDKSVAQFSCKQLRLHTCTCFAHRIHEGLQQIAEAGLKYDAR